MRKSYSKSRRSKDIIYVVVFTMIASLLIYKLVHSFIRLGCVKRELSILEDKIGKYNQENDVLVDKILSIDNDIDLLETCIRLRLKYVKKNEIIVTD